MEVENVKIELLKSHPQNPRVGDVKAIAESIKTNGWWGTVVAQKTTNHVLAGNHRVLAAKSLDIKEIPVYWLDVDDDQALKILLADNKTSDLGGYNDKQLLNLLTNVFEGGELGGTGWDSEDLNNLTKMYNDLPDINTDPVTLQLNYSVLVICDDDQHQRETLETLTNQGFQVSASML